MLAYIARRLVLILPTLFGIMVVNFVIVQAAPGGPVELMIARIKGTAFDVWTSGFIIVGYAIPGFLFAILLIVLFAGGSFVQWFPLRGLVSPDWHQLAWPARVADYLWHVTLPVVSLVVGGFAGLTMLAKH